MRRLCLIGVWRWGVFFYGNGRWAGGKPAKKIGRQEAGAGEEGEGRLAAPRLLAGIEAIEAALNKPIHCEFVETPLKDVVDYSRMSCRSRFASIVRRRSRRRALMSPCRLPATSRICDSKRS